MAHVARSEQNLFPDFVVKQAGRYQSAYNRGTFLFFCKNDRCQKVSELVGFGLQEAQPLDVHAEALDSEP